MTDAECGIGFQHFQLVPPFRTTGLRSKESAIRLVTKPQTDHETPFEADLRGRAESKLSSMRYRCPSLWSDAATDLVKMHAISLHGGVKKVLWYNYVDRGDNKKDPENFFGLMTHQRFPRPAYAAYTNLVRLLEGKKVVEAVPQNDGVAHYVFKDSKQTVAIIWCGEGRTVQLADLSGLNLESAKNKRIVNIVGAVKQHDHPSLAISKEPLFLVMGNQ